MGRPAKKPTALHQASKSVSPVGVIQKCLSDNNNDLAELNAAIGDLHVRIDTVLGGPISPSSSGVNEAQTSADSATANALYEQGMTIRRMTEYVRELSDRCQL